MLLCIYGLVVLSPFTLVVYKITRMSNLIAVMMYGNICSNKYVVSSGAKPCSSCSPLKCSLPGFHLQTNTSL
jgi:hypothetical protein